MSKVFIVAPAGIPSGGPELCHQLADALNQETKRAFMLYWPFDQRHDVPWFYEHYNVDSAISGDVEPGSIIILPEAAIPLVDKFPESSVYFWWMSVDGFYEACEKGHRDLGLELDKLHQFPARHLYQSDYARAFLESQGLTPASRLGDRLSKEYLEAIANPTNQDRHSLLVYNPLKGYDQTRRIFKAMGKRGGALPQIATITKMYPDAVRELLGHAKVYIDFGHHPGKDRLPREAAACGACIITNRRGAAGNSIDVPIPDEFKIDDQAEGFEVAAVDKIYELLNDFHRQQPRFDGYRKLIAQESVDFADDVAAIFGTSSPCGVSL